MPRIEKLCAEIWRDPDFRLKWLVGGLVASIPLVNLLALGYFLRYARQLRTGGPVTLPAWDNWPELLLDGVRMLVLQLLFLGLPLLLGWLVSWLLSLLFSLLFLGLLGATVAWIFFFPVFGIGLVLWLAALQRYLPVQDWSRVFELPAVGQTALGLARTMAVPVLAFCGLMILGWPLLGFTFFLGFGPLVAYGTAAYLDARTASAD